MQKELAELFERELQRGLRNGLIGLSAIQFAENQVKGTVAHMVQRFVDDKTDEYLRLLST
jgi:hypothetical protein